MNKRQKEVEKAKLEAEKREVAHLKAIYKKASEDISNKIAISDGKINVLLKDIDNLDDTQKSILQSQIYQKKFQESLKKQIDGFMQELEAKQYESVDAYLKAAYETGYIGTMYDIAGQGIPLVMPIDQKAAARAMTHDTKLSKRLYTKLGEDVNLLKKRVANNIARGIATADSYANIARNIAEGTNIGINRTMTIARTEGHRIQVLGAVDAQQKAKDAGADVVKQWDAALDGRTRPHHRQLDGQIRELDEPFEVDGMNPMYPSGFGKASEDINCRCALLQRARWALDDDELETLKKRAEFYGLDKTKDFNDYKKKYLTASTKSSELTNRRKERLAARNAAKNNTLPDFSTMSNAGLKNYAEKNLKTQFVDFTGVNNEYAADAVKVIAEFEQKFGGTLDSLKVKFGGLPKGVYAKFDDKTNTLILKKTGSKKAFEEAQKADNFRYKHKWKTDTPYYATETYTGTIWHELAHAIDISENQNLSRALSKTSELDSLSARISAYARTTQNVRATKRSEAWAENFAAYMEGGEMAKRVPKEIADMIEDYFKKKPLKATARMVTAPNGKTFKLVKGKTVAKAMKGETTNSKPSLTREGLQLSNVEYNEVEILEAKLSEQEIIYRVGGGDKTKGSCSSLAFAYIGNKAGFDVLDFRGGNSLSIFSTMMYIKDIADLKGVKSFVIKDLNGFKAVNTALKSIEENKEYYLSAGEHAAIVRKTKAGYEFLELQSPTDNGFKKLTKGELKNRFGLTKTQSVAGIKLEQQVVVIEAESLYNNAEFIKLLGYLNTAEGKQMKGADGHAK